MADRLFRSRLGKTKSGYRWIQAVPWPNPTNQYPGWFLTDEEPCSTPSPQEWYDPSHDNPQLFLEFARIDYFQDSKGVLLPEIDPDCQTENSIRGFANRYGLLTDEGMIERPAGSSSGPLRGESRLLLWEKEIKKMKFAVDMWAMLSPTVDTERLQQFIWWHSDKIVFYDPSGQRGKNGANLGEPIVHFTHLKKGDYERAAWCYLATAVNQREPYRLLAPRLEFEQHHPPQLRLHFAPRTLLGELWLQFAQAIDQGREYRKCLYCKEAFIVGTGVKQNKKREYCTDSHRVMHWREQRKLLKTASPPKRSRRKSA